MLCVLFVTKINHIFIYAQVIRIQISKCTSFFVYQLFAHLSSVAQTELCQLCLYAFVSRLEHGECCVCVCDL